jgi:hypothetical protein
MLVLPGGKAPIAMVTAKIRMILGAKLGVSRATRLVPERPVCLARERDKSIQPHLVARRMACLGRINTFNNSIRGDGDG